MRLGISFNFLKESLENKNAIKSYYSPPRSSLMQFQAARGARNYVLQNIETRGGKKTQLRLFNGMVLARQNQVSVEFDQCMG